MLAKSSPRPIETRGCQCSLCSQPWSPSQHYPLREDPGARQASMPAASIRLSAAKSCPYVANALADVAENSSMARDACAET